MTSLRSPLAEYNKRRNFGVTREPKGKLGRGRSGRMRFLVQKHDATRLHYDLRLEWDGVLKSWAVTRGPSLNPEDKRLAVRTEDHPLAYGDFEGTIPEKQYGGGTVMLWDSGWWEPENRSGRGLARRQADIPSSRSADARRVGIGADAVTPRRKARELAADQGG
ncbi:DNA ligase D-like protein (predicted 3'-phosphoesterase) [Ensifer adhaerens]|nr:DNA ligase D-like protein (predicted 3'-phosphoesterase) [Ensifer adhaerens]